MKIKSKVKEAYPYQDASIASRPGEQWKDIPGFDGYYCVSNFGRVKRLAFEIQCTNGQVRKIKSRMMTIEISGKINSFVNDEIHFLRIKIMSSGILYNFSIQRLVYYCFVRKFDLSDLRLLVLCKDGNGKNIFHENLELVTPKRKQNRVFDRNRWGRDYLYSYDEFACRGLEKSSISYCKQVSQYSTDGVKIKTYPSINAASESMNLSATGIISVLKGRQVSHGHFIWRYGNAASVDMKNFMEKKTLHYKKLVGQKVTQYDTNGKRIATFLTISDAAKATGIGNGEISCVLSGKQRSAGGYVWVKGWGQPKIDLSNYLVGEKWRALRHQKKVKQYHANGKYIRTFPSVKDAAKSMGITPSGISAGLDREGKLAAGFVWKSAH